MNKLAIFLLALLICLYLWSLFVAAPFKSNSGFQILRARLGTVLWHSSDENGIYQAAYHDPLAVDHVYCYYPLNVNASGLMLVRKDNGDCSAYMGEVIIRESAWVSEREKYF